MQSANKPCAYHHKTWRLHLLTYSDNILAWGHKADVHWFFEQFGKCFSIKPPSYLLKSEIGPPGHGIFKTDAGTHLSMQSYAEVKCHRLGIDINRYKGKSRLLMSKPITDLEPCAPDECQQFMSACGMVGWASGTGRPDCRVYHSRISQYTAAPVKGALSAAMGIDRELSRL